MWFLSFCAVTAVALVIAMCYSLQFLKYIWLLRVEFCHWWLILSVWWCSLHVCCLSDCQHYSTAFRMGQKKRCDHIWVIKSSAYICKTHELIYEIFGVLLCRFIPNPSIDSTFSKFIMQGGTMLRKLTTQILLSTGARAYSEYHDVQLSKNCANWCVGVVF